MTNSKIFIGYYVFTKKSSRKFKSQQQKKQKLFLPAILKALKVSEKFRTFLSGLHPQQNQSPISFNTLPNEKNKVLQKKIFLIIQSGDSVVQIKELAATDFKYEI